MMDDGLRGSTTREILYLGILLRHNRAEKSLYSAIHIVRVNVCDTHEIKSHSSNKRIEFNLKNKLW
jgi:hypothetical protein